MTIYRHCVAAMAAAAMALIGSVLCAPIVALNTGLSLNWSSPSNLLDIPITPSGSPVLAGWDLNLQLVPLGGASGTLSFDPTTLAIGSSPTQYPVPPNSALTHSPFISTPATGPVTQIHISGVDQSSSDTITSLKNLVELQFASSGASGDFALQATLNGSVTGWSTPTPVFSGFSNASNGATITLGTIHVAPAAVPEPASMMLGAISALGVAGYGWRRKRQVPVTIDPV